MSGSVSFSYPRWLNVTISSRTPEGMPSKCVLCDAKTNIEFSSVGGDATCPNCGHLLWSSAQMIQTVTKRFEDVLGTSLGLITANTRFSDISVDSLETIELVMELEEDYDISILEDDSERFQTIGDAVRYIQNHRRGTSE